MEISISFFALATLLLVQCLLNCSIAITITNLTIDQSSLVALKSHITSDPYNSLTNNWTIETSVCSWIGVTCSSHRHSRIIALDISNMELNGTIPPEIGNLSFLVSLNIYGNRFHGNLPKELAHLHRLKHIDFSMNEDLTGEIPKFWFDSLLQLQFLDLSHNSLQGKIPPAIFKSSTLESIYLGFNNLTGSLPIDICSNSSLQRLKWFYLSSNKLSGGMSSSLGQCSHLQDLDLSNNTLNGHVPLEIGNLSKLEILNLARNKFEGPIPQTIFKSSTLVRIVLKGNNFSQSSLPVDMCSNNTLRRLELLKLSSNNLSGEMPSSLGQCSRLQYLDLSDNELSGIISPEIGKLHDLYYLELSGNQLSGPITSKIGNLSNVLYLYLSENNLDGTIPLEIGKLKFLIRLNLDKNRLHGNLPNIISNLTSLEYLSLESNEFSGNISYKQLPTNLQSISLFNNSFQGSIPPNIEIFQNLSYINLAKNQLSGPIPSTICNLSFLEFLHLSSNNLEGTIPSCLGRLSRLRSFNLKANHIHGLIPTFISPCILESLNLNSNKLQGPLPKSLIRCDELQVIDIGGNEIQDSFPFWMETLPMLRVLVLRSNRFHGIISHSLKNKLTFPRLQVFDLSHNDFIGPLPTEYLNNFIAIMNVKQTKTDTGHWFSYYEESMTLVVKGSELKFERILETLTTIDLSNNNFHGNIPHSIGKLNSLRYLNLSHNSLTGQIPASIGDIPSLESLDLSSNQLIGEIPLQLTRLTFLSKLNLSQNHLVGHIPQSGGQFITFDNSSYLGNSELCGLPLTKKCKEVEPPLLPILPQQDDDSGFLDGFTWQVVLTGYGCGFFFGITVGCYIFSYGRPRWFVNLFFVVQ